MLRCASLFFLSVFTLLCVIFFTLGEIHFFKNPDFCKILY